MSGKASNSQPAVGFSGSGALSHVYIQYPPLRCGIPGSRVLFYDDGNRLLLSPTSDQIFAWKVVPFSPDSAPTADSINDGPILSIRFSLDGKLVAIQRSSHEIQFQHRITGETFTQRCKSESESILGFFWTDCPLCDIVFVKTSGLDFFTYNSDSKTLHLVETRKLNVCWYVYTHESRLVLLASGMQCKNFTGFQLSSAGIIRLPKFEMVMAKTEANSKPVLAVEDVYIVTVYGRIYCLQVDRVAMLLHSYRFYRDAVVQQGSMPIYSSKIAISVVDNVLLVHQVDAKVIILYDIFFDSRAPISAPLPLILRGLPRSSSIGSRPTSRNKDSPEANCLSDNEATVYGEDWNFLMPDLVCDFSNKLLWKLNLDLEAIAASNSEVSSVLDFLQRRKLEAYKAKHICLAMIRTAILERRPLAMVSRATDVVVTSYAHSLKTATSKPAKGDKTPATATANAQSSSRLDRKSMDHHLHAGLEDDSFERSTFSGTDDTEENGPFEQARTESNNKLVMGAGSSSYKGESLFNASTSEQQEPQLSSAVISPDEMYTFVFGPVEEEMGGDPSYLVAIIIDFLKSASSEKIKVHPNMFVLMVQLLARNERFSELGMFVINKIIEPSREVAMQLLESGRQNHETRKLGLDMLRQLSLHHDYLVFLVQEGYYLEALRYMRKHQVTTVRPSLFLEAASASNDPQHVAAVLRFYTDYVPGFSHTPDYKRYYNFLNEISAGLA